MGVNGTYGLSGSGLDVDTIVKKLMDAQKIPYTKIYQQKTRYEWKKTQYNDMYTSLSSFRNDISAYRLQGTLRPKTVSVSDSGVLSATGNADAVDFTHAINVTSVAQSASMISKGKVSFYKVNDDTGIIEEDASRRLSSLFTSSNVAGAPPTDPDHFPAVPGEVGKLPPELQAVVDAQKDVGTAVSALLAAEEALAADVDNPDLILARDNAKTALNTARQDLTQVASKEVVSLNISDGTTNKTIKYTAGELLNKNIYDLVSDVNKQGLNVQASYDTNTGRVFLYSKTSGAQSQIELKALGASGSGNSDLGIKMLKNLNFIDHSAPAGKYSASTNDPADGFTEGKDAAFTVDGMAVTSEKNVVTIAGVTYTLKKLGSTSVQVNTDVEKTVETVQKFVDTYNAMLEALNKINNQEYYKKYAPLTDEEKDGLSEDQIKQWEAKAKSGLLRHDPLLMGTIRTMKSSMTNFVDGTGSKYNSLATLGITTKNDLSEGGKLYLDVDKLKAALDKDPDCVSNVFSADSSSDPAKTSEMGVARRLYDQMTSVMKSLSENAGVTGKTDTESPMAKQLQAYDEKLDRMERRLKALEAKYYRQFDSLETMIGNINAQSSWITQQFGG